MPGVGAIGSEFKKYGLMGVSTSQEFQFIIIDYDLIKI